MKQVGQVLRSRLDVGVQDLTPPTATKAYIARRVSEGRGEREAVRCLKRYQARSLFRLLEAMPRA